MTKAPTPFQETRQVILPPMHRLTRLIAQDSSETLSRPYSSPVLDPEKKIVTVIAHTAGEEELSPACDGAIAQRTTCAL